MSVGVDRQDEILTLTPPLAVVGNPTRSTVERRSATVPLTRSVLRVSNATHRCLAAVAAALLLAVSAACASPARGSSSLGSLPAASSGAATGSPTIAPSAGASTGHGAANGGSSGGGSSGGSHPSASESVSASSSGKPVRPRPSVRFPSDYSVSLHGCAARTEGVGLHRLWVYVEISHSGILPKATVNYQATENAEGNAISGSLTPAMWTYSGPAEELLALGSTGQDDFAGKTVTIHVKILPTGLDTDSTNNNIDVVLSAPNPMPDEGRDYEIPCSD
jgi:hypothetical protein